jgi:hypothetical protein
MSFVRGTSHNLWQRRASISPLSSLTAQELTSVPTAA